MKRWAVLLTLMGISSEPAGAVDPPCDAYPPAKQVRCMTGQGTCCKCNKATVVVFYES